MLCFYFEMLCLSREGGGTCINSEERCNLFYPINFTLTFAQCKLYKNQFFNLCAPVAPWGLRTRKLRGGSPWGWQVRVSPAGACPTAPDGEQDSLGGCQDEAGARLSREFNPQVGVQVGVQVWTGGAWGQTGAWLQCSGGDSSGRAQRQLKSSCQGEGVSPG